jgi:hypothetical protein
MGESQDLCLLHQSGYVAVRVYTPARSAAVVEEEGMRIVAGISQKGGAGKPHWRFI